MAAGSYSKRTWRSAQGGLRAFYVRTLIGQTWLAAGSADSEAQLAALIGRVQRRCPERPMRVERNVGGTLVVVEEATTLAAAA